MMFGDNTTITTYRMVDATDITSFSVTATVEDAPAFIDAPSAELRAVLGEQPGLEVYECHVDPGDYLVGDKVVDAQGNEYRIAGIERHENNTDTDDVYTLMLHKQATYYNT
jgi:hypothetical protein